MAGLQMTGGGGFGGGRKGLPKARGSKMVVPYSRNLIIGRSGTGKTVVLQALIRYGVTPDTEVYVWSSTEDGNDGWSPHVPRTFIFTSWNDAEFERIIRRAHDRVDAWKRAGARGAKPGTVIILEDMAAGLNKIQKNETFQDLFYAGRHFGISIYIITQYIYTLLPTLRSQINLILCTEEVNMNNLKRIHLEWGSVHFPKLADWNNFFSRVTQDYRVLCIDMKRPAKERLSWFKATMPIPRFRIGTKDQWEYHRQNNIAVQEAGGVLPPGSGALGAQQEESSSEDDESDLPVNQWDDDQQQHQHADPPVRRGKQEVSSSEEDDYGEEEDDDGGYDLLPVTVSVQSRPRRR
jgi:hypothetical protein